ncbi:MAG: hypothetical protein OQK04_07180, partial [Kangiellaceae bacterium]|nr:hypothetical protein [Kangiellaceae bacterium]
HRNASMFGYIINSYAHYSSLYNKRKTPLIGYCAYLISQGLRNYITKNSYAPIDSAVIFNVP